MQKDQMFEDRKKKLYYKAFGSATLCQIKKERSPFLFDYIIQNYERIAKKYTEQNKDAVFFGKPVDVYLKDEGFQKLKKELRAKTTFNNGQVTIVFASSQTLCYLKHESMKPEKKVST